jgi:hypothetical protein
MINEKAAAPLQEYGLETRLASRNWAIFDEVLD